jgi:hypothetical protein
MNFALAEAPQGHPVSGQGYMDPKCWYQSLPIEQKRRVFEDALRKFPYLSDMMKMHNVRASQPEFTEHFTFKLLMDILRPS